jgi:hypothetical protein
MNDTDESIRANAQTTFFRPHDAVRIHHGHLPHWRQEGAMYFVTGRLADSMPQAKLKQWQHERALWRKAHGIAVTAALDTLHEKTRNEFHARFTRQWRECLDLGYGECLLRRADVRELFLARLVAGDGEAWLLDAWVAMPNHFHAVVTPVSAAGLGKVVWASAQKLKEHFEKDA